MQLRIPPPLNDERRSSAQERRPEMRFYLSDSLPTLLLTFPGGDSSEYRMRQGNVEFRANHGAWQVLSESDVRLHFVLGTEVAKWLQQRRV